MTDSPRHPWLVRQGAVLPPPRPGVRHVRVIGLGVVIADDRLRRRIARRFHWPMIVLALLVLPLLVIEIMRKIDGPLDLAVRIGFGVIWVAFVIEFIVKIAVAESRLQYARRNWLDLIIIVVPILRPLRLTGSIVRTTRVFKLRGVGMKCARYVLTILLGFEATERILQRVGIKRVRERKDPDAMTRHELSTELRKLRKRTDAWERWYEAHQEHQERHEGKLRDVPTPELPPVPGSDDGEPAAAGSG